MKDRRLSMPADEPNRAIRFLEDGRNECVHDSILPQADNETTTKLVSSRVTRNKNYGNRRRLRSEHGKELLRRRGELLERSFAHA